MLIDISTLPKNIQDQLPLSIRTFKKEYEFEDLPVRIQYLIMNYKSSEPDVNYKISFDLIPTVSEYNDFKSIDNTVDLVVEYLKNYLVVLPGAYPFDPTFGCRLKYHIQTRDTTLRQTLISSEINNIIGVIEGLLNVAINIDSISIEPTSVGSHTEFNIFINLNINNVHKKISLQIS
jgi:hypothetical protein